VAEANAATKMDDPLDFIDFADIIAHGDPSTWKYQGAKAGSPTPANSPHAPPGTMKHYDIYEDEYEEEIKVHYFRHPDGSVGDVKIKD
jgi:hypothetical protein